MKTIKINIIILISLFLFFNGCTKEENPLNPGDTNGPNYTFGTVGNKWIYEHTNQDNQTLPDVTYEIVQHMGNNVYKIAINFPNSTFVNIVNYWFIKDTVFAMNCDSTGTQIELFINELREVNRTYITTVHNNPFYNDGDTLYVKLLSLETPVTVPAGTFNCIKFEVSGRIEGEMTTTTVYISRVVGQVYQHNQYMSLKLKSKNF